MVDESLSDLDRTCLLISTGQDVQKMCALDHLPDLLKTEQMETLCRVIPKLCVRATTSQPPRLCRLSPPPFFSSFSPFLPSLPLSSSPPSSHRSTQDMLPTASTEVQVLASRVLGEAVQQDLIPVHIFTSTCLTTVLAQMESRDQGMTSFTA